jgi:hypothetical protein
MSIVGYSYQADTYCPRCISDIVRAHLPTGLRHPVDEDGGEYPWDTEWFLTTIAPFLGIDRMDEHTFDSDDFPKVIFSHQIETDEYCGNPKCEETL